MGSEQDIERTEEALNQVRLISEIARVLYRSGLIPRSLGHWLKALRAFYKCGPSFAFLAKLAAIRFGDFEALCDDCGALTFRQLNDRAESLARFLRVKEGVNEGQQVAILFSNHRGFVLSLLAVTRLGADVLPLNPKVPREVLEPLLERQEIDLLLVEVEASERVRGIPTRTLVCKDGLDAPAVLGRVRRGGQLVVLTSGTTGTSKGIRRKPSLGELLPVTAGLLRDLPLKMHRPSILAIPLYHGYGLATLALTLANGSPLLTGRKYDVETLLERSVKGEPALLITVPTLLWRWHQRGCLGADSVGAIITGSAPLTPQLCRCLGERLGPILYNLYGSTESGLIALATPAMLTQAPGCVGRPLPGNRIRLVEKSGEIGRIEVSGPLVLQPGPDGWRETGDLGRFDRDKNLYVCGRADNMIVSGGENIYPHELEELLSQHHDIEDFAVLAVPDEEFGQRLVAAVVVLSDSGLEDSDIAEWLRGKVEGFKRPKAIYLLNSLPKNPLGKVEQKVLLEQLGYSL